jgi:hypothetical protein
MSQPVFDVAGPSINRPTDRPTDHYPPSRHELDDA